MNKYVLKEYDETDEEEEEEEMDFDEGTYLDMFPYEEED